MKNKVFPFFVFDKTILLALLKTEDSVGEIKIGNVDPRRLRAYLYDTSFISQMEILTISS